MKRMRHMSIRMRITLMTAFLVILVAAAVTASSILNANEQFQTIQYVVVQPYLMDSEYGTYASAYDVIGDIDEYAIAVSDENESVLEVDQAAIVINTARDSFHTQTLLILAAVIVLSVVLAWLLSGWMLAPVKKLDAAVSEVSSATLSARLPEPQTMDEIGSLTQSFNHMLDRLEADFERQKQYSSAVAHELKTPLSTIKATLQVANMEQKIDPDLYAITVRNIARLSGVVTELLQLYNEVISQESTPIALAPLLRDISSELQKAHPDHPTALIFEGEDEAPELSGNPVLMRRLFSNILDNAFKYTLADGKITISYCKAHPDVSVTIADTGIGIEEEALAHIFEPFYRADASRSRDTGGSGLGLSIVKTIADSLGYTLSCTSEPSVGTSLTVKIPLSSGADA